MSICGNRIIRAREAKTENYQSFKTLIMKTLLKISLCLVLGLFISTSVIAQVTNSNDYPAHVGTYDYDDNTNAAGVINLNVAPFMEYAMTDFAELTFMYDHTAPGSSTSPPTTEIIVKANVPWKFTVDAAADFFTGELNDLPKTVILADVRNGTAETMHPLGSVVPYAGNGAYAGSFEETIHIDWGQDFTGYEHITAGDYTLDIVYTISSN